MKTLRVGVANYQEMKARTMAIARGEHKPGVDEPKVDAWPSRRAPWVPRPALAAVVHELPVGPDQQTRSPTD